MLESSFRPPIAFVAGVAVALGLSLEGAARADELDEGVPFQVGSALQGNPLGLIIGRYSADLEYFARASSRAALLARGVLSRFRVWPTSWSASVRRWATAGTRVSTGAHGFFVGASFIALSLHYLHGALPGVPLDAARGHFVCPARRRARRGLPGGDPRQLRRGRRARSAVHGGYHAANLRVPEHIPCTTCSTARVFGPRVLLSLGAAF